MEELFLKLLNMSITATYVFAGVFVLRLVLKRAPKCISYALWSLVLFRLVCPVSFSSVLSVFNRLGGGGTSATTGFMEFFSSGTVSVTAPHIKSEIPGVNESIGSSLPTATNADPVQFLLYLGMIVWLTGIAIMLVYGVASYIRLKSRLSEATLWQGNVFETDSIASPFVCGFFRPRIYLPVGLSETGREYVLRHERIHIRRGDQFLKLLGFIVLSVHWFNPFMWLAFVLMGRDMEMSCDERVIRELEPDDRAGYGETLAGLTIKRPLLAGSPIAFGESGTKGRINYVLNYKKPAFWVSVVAVVAVVILAVCLLTNPRTEMSGEIYDDGTAALTVTNSGTDYAGVAISMRAWELDTSPTSITVDWNNTTEEAVTYGAAYHIFKLENGTWISCASETEVVFVSIGYRLAPSATAVKNYNNYAFDLSRTGTYRLKTSFFLDKDIPITEYEHYTTWIEFEISKKTEYNSTEQTLYTLKTPDVGNVSAVGAILETVGVGELGAYTFEPQTDTQPYGVTVTFERGTTAYSEKTASDKMIYCGGILLALVENAETLTWNYPNGTGGYNTGAVSYRSFVEAESKIASDIKQFGASPEQLEKLISLLSDGDNVTTIGGADTVGAALEAAVVNFMEDGWWYGGEKHTGTFKASSFVSLHEEETDGGLAFYGVSMYRSYNYSEGDFSVAESFQEPCVITLDKASLACADIWIPGDGAYFDMDMYEKFPKEIVEAAALYYTNYFEHQAAACDEKARVYGGVETTEFIT